MSRRSRWTPAPADVTLELLREQRRPYRCHAQIGRWDASCPLCDAPLVIRELGHRGAVRLRCQGGCDESAMKHRLRHPEICPRCGAVHGQAAELARLADEATHVARACLQLVRDAIADPEALAV